MTSNEKQIHSWLKGIFTEENVDDFSVQILGNSEKGDGYVGDIVFVRLASAVARPPKEYNLVLKCSKQSPALRETAPVKEAFINEIYIYNTVLPVFTQFQLEHGIDNPFDSFPRCYGKFTSDDMEVIVFENLKSVGYTLWNKKQPLTRNHIDMVMTEYSKFHAISFAMKDQQLEKFEQLSTGLTDVFKMFMDIMDIENMFRKSFDDVYDLLKGDLDDNTLMTWKNFRNQIKYIFNDLGKEPGTKKVITHGDCWNNNFMFKHAVSLLFFFEKSINITF
jgi:hypothetical protein